MSSISTPLHEKGIKHGNDRITSEPYRTSPGNCGSHRLRRRGHAALAAGLRPGGQYP